MATEANNSKQLKSLVVKYKSEWKINHFACMTRPMATPVFSPLEDIDMELFFDIFYSTIISTDHISYLQVRLKKTARSPIPETLKYFLCVYVCYSSGDIYAKYITNNPYKLSTLFTLSCINHSTPFSSKPSRDLPYHGMQIQTSFITLKCEFTFFNYLPRTEEYRAEIKSHDHLLDYTKNYKTIYQSKEFSDVSVKVGERTVECHKFVLAAHSPVFRSILEDEGAISVSDVSYETFERFLNYLYCAEVEDTSLDKVLQLNFLANRYEVKALQKECVRILSKSSLKE